MLTNVTYVHVD